MGGPLALWCIDHRRSIFAAMLLLVVALGALIPRIQIDTDPENMLPADQADRVLHNEIREQFNLNEMVVVGQVNRDHPDGIFNPDSLADHYHLTRAIEQIDGVIARDLLAMAAVDNVEQSAPGTIDYDWLIGAPPQSQEEADRIRAAVERLPMYQGTLASEDGTAAGIFVPIASKDYSHRIAGEIRAAAAEIGVTDELHITGQPVAQDTFGVEMFQQMAVSAPLAGLIIFLVMLYFFRNIALVIAPMLLAMTVVISTMGLLIGTGFTVHIMSSMIPIFLMPIAVVASVHVLSNFADRYRPGDDPRAVMGEVMQRLYKPVLFTGLTTGVGFASLIFTPIPPVQVFGAFISFGVLLALLLTLTFIPAYVGSLSRRNLDRMAARVRQDQASEQSSKMCTALGATGRFAVRRRGWIVSALVLLVAVAAFGINQIQINDNPTRWFKASHDIRIADAVLNERFAGTYEAYIRLQRTGLEEVAEELRTTTDEIVAEAAEAGHDLAPQWEELWEQSRGEGPLGDRLEALAIEIDDLLFEVDLDQAEHWEALLDAVEAARTETRAFQEPRYLAWMADLQRYLEEQGVVGKSSSLADLVKTVNRELISGDPADFRLPERSGGVSQALLSFQGSHRPHDLWRFVTPDYTEANLWLQLPSGDNQDMSRVVAAVERYLVDHPPPENVELDWAGATYINLIWQGEMVNGMLFALLSAFVVVLIMMIALFRSLTLGLLAMLPLTVTIAFIYGVMGLIGKDYDMPVAVLSSLSIGLSVDFAIHFIQRLRMALEETGSWRTALEQVYREPACAISRNAIVIAVGFLPLLAAPLVPYITVGTFLASIMAASALVTLLALPALIALRPGLFLKETGGEAGKETGAGRSAAGSNL
ncbi:RND transporter [Halorhodospira abdelmalekii]|uniref:efflux RND transporter permease subunit n=1 Tax=Halorhodospira abdelmalekii TaxID=421629 RepID=UPI0019075E4C|nr:MMPL family transporter [Halorhodospira abdelmalekii]MBK1733866.1 RND transporter [Halorhodospira abdelmalekii]